MLTNLIETYSIWVVTVLEPPMFPIAFMRGSLDRPINRLTRSCFSYRSSALSGRSGRSSVAGRADSAATVRGDVDGWEGAGKAALALRSVLPVHTVLAPLTGLPGRAAGAVALTVAF